MKCVAAIIAMLLVSAVQCGKQCDYIPTQSTCFSRQYQQCIGPKLANIKDMKEIKNVMKADYECKTQAIAKCGEQQISLAKESGKKILKSLKIEKGLKKGWKAAKPILKEAGKSALKELGQPGFQLVMETKKEEESCWFKALRLCIENEGKEDLLTYELCSDIADKKCGIWY